MSSFFMICLHKNKEMIFLTTSIDISLIFTGQVFLKSSLQSKNKFERGNTDEFVLEAVNIGELKKIK